MRKSAYMLVVAVLLCAAPAFAQGPFMDVPTDHWAYDAVNTLQRDGIIIGYPDGTFGGKRAMSRYEFAVAVARILPLIPSEANLSNYVTKQELREALEGLPTGAKPIDLSKYATKQDVEAIRRLVDEFRDEIAALGVDVDALKRDVAALAARVDALEAMVKRVQFYGDVNVFAIATTSDDHSRQSPVDLDQRVIATGVTDTLARSLTIVRDFDLSVVGRVSETVTANATINFGNYLNYLTAVDDYVDSTRPTTRAEVQTVGGLTHDFVDAFFPYYLYVDAGFGSGAVTVGRFPMQFTPYTFKKIDVDSYTSILKTDSGNYPLDGVKLAVNLLGLDWMLFGAKHDLNDYLVNGLTGQPRAGLYGIDDASLTFNDIGGNVVGGLTALLSQSAGIRAIYGAWNGTVGVTYYQGWSRAAFDDPLNDFDQARVFGADVNIPIGSFGFDGSWTASEGLVQDGVPGQDVDSRNVAWDGKFTVDVGKLGIGAGYKRIEHNFAAAGAWDKIGRWTNPTNIEGPYLDLTYPLGRKLKVVLNGEWVKMIDTLSPTLVTRLNGFGLADDKVIKGEAGLEWGLSAANSLALGYQWVRYSPDVLLDDGTETYLTVGWAHQFGPNAGFKLGYQFINWDGGNDQIVYGTDYRGNLGVVQFGVTF